MRTDVVAVWFGDTSLNQNDQLKFFRDRMKTTGECHVSVVILLELKISFSLGPDWGFEFPNFSLSSSSDSSTECLLVRRKTSCQIFTTKTNFYMKFIKFMPWCSCVTCCDNMLQGFIELCTLNSCLLIISTLKLKFLKTEISKNFFCTS